MMHLRHPLQLETAAYDGEEYQAGSKALSDQGYRLCAEEAANADWRIETVVYFRAFAWQRVRSFEQNIVGRSNGLRCYRGGTGNIPTWAVPALNIRDRDRMGRACKQARKYRDDHLEMPLAHQRGQTKVGKCNVPNTRFERFRPAVIADLVLSFGVGTLAWSLNGTLEAPEWLSLVMGHAWVCSGNVLGK